MCEKFYDKIFQDKSYKSYYADDKILQHYGIISLFELRVSGFAHTYMYQYNDYRDYCPIEEIRFDEDCGRNIDVYDFLKFNDYMILLTKTMLERYKENFISPIFNETEISVLNQIMEENKNNQRIHEMIESEVSGAKQLIDIKNEENNHRGEHFLESADHFLEKFLTAKLLINPKENPRIVIFDSY